MIRTKYERLYHIPELNKSLPSVTTILDLLAKPALIRWAVKQTLENKDYEVTRQEAADLGTSIHNLIETYLKKEEYQFLINDINRKLFTDFRDWQKKHKFELVDSEQTVWSTKGFAGTLDIACYLNGKLYVVDVKTGSRIWGSHLLQIAAYREAYQERMGKKVKGLGVLRLDKIGKKPEWKTYTLKEANKAFKKFMLLCKYWHLEKEDKNAV